MKPKAVKRGSQKRPEAARTVVIYARVSTREQEEGGYSIDAQLGLLRSYAAERGLQVVEELIESETAKASGRPEFQRMLELIEKGQASAILCEKVDRLYRNLADRVRVGELGAELHFVKEGTILSEQSKSHEKFIHDIKLVVAKNYIDNLSEETRKGMAEKARQGIWPSAAPYGYINITIGNRRSIEVDRALSGRIRQLFEEYAKGRSSLSDIRDLARELGLVSRKGKPLHTSMIARLLSNPIYCGLVHWNGETFPGQHDAIVPFELWEEVNEVMEGRGSRAGFGSLDFAYKGVFTCAHCGCAVTAEQKKGGRYIYYHCTGNRGRCPGQKVVNERRITEQIAGLLEQVQIPAEILEMLREALLQSLAEERDFHDSRREILKKACADLEAKLERLYLDKVSGDVPMSAYEKLKGEWEEELAKSQAQLARMGEAQSGYFDLGVSLLELGSNCHDRFKRANPKQKRELIDCLCSNCTLEDGKVQISLKEPFRSMLEVRREAGDSAEIAKWLPDQDSNLDRRHQKPLSYH